MSRRDPDIVTLILQPQSQPLQRSGDCVVRSLAAAEFCRGVLTDFQLCGVDEFGVHYSTASLTMRAHISMHFNALLHDPDIAFVSFVIFMILACGLHTSELSCPANIHFGPAPNPPPFD